MSLFLFIEYQDGGCDYTIGCGVRVNKLIEADSPEQAREKFIAAYEADCRYDDGTLCGNPWYGDHTADDIEMYEVVTQHKFDIIAVADRAQKEVDGIKQQEVEDAERAEYERLRGKFGK